MENIYTEFGVTKRIAYLDTFCPEHSGRFWKKAFEEYGTVGTIEIGGLKDVKRTIRRVINFRPDHIHFGGSTQSEKTFKISDILGLKEKTGATITFFYGDGYYRWPYFSELADAVDGIYVTNSNLCKKSNIHHTLCPAPIEMAIDYKAQPMKHELVFIGNNYNSARRKHIYAIHKLYPLTVFGAGWKKRRVNARGSISYEDYPKVCQSSKVVLGDPAGPICYYSDQKCGVGNPDGLHSRGYCRAYECSEYTELEGYVSNRVSNILMSGGVCLTPYVKGLEKLVTNGKHLQWYKDWKQFQELVKHLINTDMSQMREAGQAFMLENYTFEKVARRILDEDGTNSPT